MNTAYSYQSNSLVYKTPPLRWWQGWLCGNGSGGATIWHSENSLDFQLGHTDLMDISKPKGKDILGKPGTRHNIRGSLRIHGAPMFDPYYVQNYEALTDLLTGITDMHGQSEFGKFEMTAFYLKNPNVFVLRYQEHTKEALVHSLELEKRGSRFFSRIWSGTDADTSLGLGKTSISDQGDILELVHEKEGFCMADVVQIQSDIPYSDNHTAYTVERTFAPADNFSLEIRVFLGLHGTLDECLQEAREQYRLCRPISFCDLRSRKAKEYKDELPDVGICLPEQPYYENLWYTSRYHMRGSYQGKYPAFFINGPFGGSHDKREWADCWLHWNMHGETQGVLPSGDWDLFHAFADYKMRQIPIAREQAQKGFGCRGIVCFDYQTPESGGTKEPIDTCGIQIYPCLQTSLMFDQYWKFTGDQEFLREKLIPYLTLTLEFWRDYLVEEDGELHVPRSIPYEFHNGYTFKDAITELSLLRACLPLLQCAEKAAGLPESELTQWCEYALEHLTKPVILPVTPMFATEIKDGKCIYNSPFFYGEECKKGDDLYALGVSGRTGKPVTHLQTYEEVLEPEMQARNACGAFCSSYTAFIYPGRLVSSDDSPSWRNKMNRTQAEAMCWERGRNALRTIRRPAPGTKNFDFLVKYQNTLNWTGHSLELPAFAKMGLAEPLQKALQFYTETFQMFPQGMFQYHPRTRWLCSNSAYTGEDRSKHFVQFNLMAMHFSFEEMGIYTQAVDLMLIDSDDGLIRTFPAYEKNAQFKLPAQGGFMVEAMQTNRQVQFVTIISRMGKSCAVRTNWEHCYLQEGSSIRELEIRNAVVKFDTKAGETYTLYPTAEAVRPADLVCHEPGPMKNVDVTLGLFPL